MSRRSYPPREYLRESLDYDPETGSLTWKDRPRDHFLTNGGWSQFNKNFAGRLALTGDDGYGYPSGRIHYEGKSYKLKAHIVAWLIHCDEELPDAIDHVDGVRSNNRWINLRAASHGENSRNRKALNPHGKGVKPRPSGRFQASITINGRRRTLGTFDTTVEANVAYQRAATTHFGEFARFQ